MKGNYKKGKSPFCWYCMSSCGIEKFLTQIKDNLYTVDLICHGSPSPELLKMYLKEKSVDIEELEGLNFREKTSFGLRSVGKNNGFPRIVDYVYICFPEKY